MPDKRAGWVSRHDHVGSMVYGTGFAWCTTERCGQRWEMDETRGWQPIPHWLPDPPGLMSERVAHDRTTRKATT